jgi:hypothetical protein
MDVSSINPSAGATPFAKSSRPSAPRAASLARWALALGAVAALPACVVVPADHHRGTPTVVSPVPVVVAPPAPQVLNVRLYPVNTEANRVGPLSAMVVDNLNGHGSFMLTYGGRAMQGEASRVGNDHPGFGRILSDQAGDVARLSGRRGVANAAATGINAQCEYVLTGPGTGVGACRMSDGARYQMHFTP